MRVPFRAALLLPLVIAACSAPGPTAPSPTASPTPTVSTTPSASASAVPSASVEPSGSPAASAVAVVKIELVGGFIAPQATLNRYPTVALYADGRLITQGSQIEVYPGPALPNLQVTQLTPHGVDQVLEWAAEAGLQGPDRFLGPPVADVGVTLFEVVRPEGPHTTSVADLTSGDQAIGALRKFQDIMLDIRAWLPNDVVGDDQPYAFDQLQILASPADAASQPDPSLVSVVDWPLSTPLATIGADFGGSRCALIDGTDLDTLRPMLATANQLTLWRSGGQTYMVQLHPLLPDGQACPNLAGP